MSDFKESKESKDSKDVKPVSPQTPIPNHTYPVMDEIVDDVSLSLSSPSSVPMPMPIPSSSLPLYTGQVKWWNDKLGFGFATVTDGPMDLLNLSDPADPKGEVKSGIKGSMKDAMKGSMKGRDVFVHHTGISAPANTFRSLRKNEIVTFNLNKSRSGEQAINVRKPVVF